MPAKAGFRPNPSSAGPTPKFFAALVVSMMPNALLASYSRTMLTDRRSSELRRYAQEEWRSQVHWIQGATPSVSLRGRLGRWLRRGRTREPGARPAVTDLAPLPPAAAGTQADGLPCPHLAQEELGLAGTTVFLRCCVCGEVLLVSGHRIWGLNAADPPAASEASCA